MDDLYVSELTVSSGTYKIKDVEAREVANEALQSAVINNENYFNNLLNWGEYNE